MATLSLYLDKRGTANEYPVKIIIRSKATSTMVSLGIKIASTQWDANKCKIINHPQKNALNSFIKQKYNEFERVMMELFALDTLAPATKIKKEVLKRLSKEYNEESHKLFIPYLETIIENKINKNTKRSYLNLKDKIVAHYNDASQLTFGDITYEWLCGFHKNLIDEKLSTNTIALYLSRLSSVVRAASKDELIAKNPFDKFIITHTQTTKRNLKLEQIQNIINYPYKPDYFHRKYPIYIRVIKLMLCFRGISMVDLVHLKKSDVNNGYIEYNRRKTKKHYIIKIEPEAEKIIEEIGGKVYLINILETNKRYESFTQRFNEALKQIGHVDRYSSYWLRHTWATICQNELHISREIISAGLGHEFGNTITSIYLEDDQEQIDEANRKFIDLVFYNKRAK